MRWLYHRLMFAVLALTALAVGSIFFQAVWHWNYPRRSPPIGYYSGSLSGQFFGEITNVASFVSFRITAETAPRWQWSDSSDFRYETVLLDPWTTNQLVITLPEMNFVKGAITNRLNEPGLLNWLQEAGQTDDRIPEDALQFILSTIEAAGNGTLRRTGHHPYQTDQAGMRLTLFNSKVGIGFPTLAVTWWAAWLVLALFCYGRLQRWEKTLP
jgi:hypothetical protein